MRDCLWRFSACSCVSLNTGKLLADDLEERLGQPAPCHWSCLHNGALSVHVLVPARPPRGGGGGGYHCRRGGGPREGLSLLPGFKVKQEYTCC